jgi:integrase
MGRPRQQPLWESDDKKIYIKRRKGGFGIFDTRTGSEFSRRSFEHAVACAIQLQHRGDLTFMDLALDYFSNGMPIEEGTENEPGLSEGWIEDQKGLVRNWYRDVLGVQVSNLPLDFIAVAEKKTRSANRSKSHQDKVAGVGLRIVEHGKALGVIPGERQFRRLSQKLRSKQGKRRGQSHKVVKRKLPSHRQAHQFARGFAAHVERPYMRLFWWLAFYMGFREGEPCALEVEDLTEVSGRIFTEVNKKVARRRSGPVCLEPYAKGYEHRTVVVPSLLVRPLLARVAEVKSGGGTLLFPSWSKAGPGPAPGERWINYNALYRTWIAVGVRAGWEVKSWQPVRQYVDSNGRASRYKEKVSSLFWHPHDARAFAATAMCGARRGLSLRGMDMSIKAIAAQLGDAPETVRAHYLGVIDTDTDDIFTAVLCLPRTRQVRSGVRRPTRIPE